MLTINPPLVVRLVKCPLLGKRYTLPSLRYVYCAGAPLKQFMEEELIRKLNVRFITDGKVKAVPMQFNTMLQIASLCKMCVFNLVTFRFIMQTIDHHGCRPFGAIQVLRNAFFPENLTPPPTPLQRFVTLDGTPPPPPKRYVKLIDCTPPPPPPHPSPVEKSPVK